MPTATRKAGKAGKAKKEVEPEGTKMDLFLISPDDVPYEQDVLRNQYTLAPWLRYLDHKSDAPLHERVFVFERACTELKRSYKLWKMYLDLRVSHVQDLNAVKYRDHFERVNECFERSLILLHKMPRIWLDYLEFLMKQPKITATRQTFDRALRALPVSQHSRVWELYLDFAKSVGGYTAVTIYRRYVQYKPQRIEDFIELLLELEYYHEACKQYIAFLNRPKFSSVKGKGHYQVWTELADLLVQHAREINFHGDAFDEDDAAGDMLKSGAATRRRRRRQDQKAVDTEKILRSGIEKFSDQRGKLWVSLATYKIAVGDFEGARDAFEEGVTTVMTIRDFTMIFDSYAEFEESVIASLMEEVELARATLENTKAPSAQDRRAVEDREADLDLKMLRFEQLMDRRPFLVNDVLLRQNPNDVVEWEKRVGLWGKNKAQVVQTYTDAMETINPKKASGAYHKLWVNYAKFYETGGDMDSARIIFDKGTKVPFRSPNELADLYIDWAEMELRHENFDRAMEIVATATKGPEKSRVDFFDDALTPQQRLHKSIKLWSFYVDMVESVGTLAETRAAYDRMFELKIATPLTVVNYASVLEEHKYYEEAFKVYERGVELFSYPVAFEIWNLYLTKAIKRELGLERLRDLFEQALVSCPAKMVKPFYILYGDLEEKRGLGRNAIKIYDRATMAVADEDRPEMFKFYLRKSGQLLGLASTRPIYERAIEMLGDKDARDMCVAFANMERKLGEIDRARAIFGHGSQFADPRLCPSYWEKWQEFEVQHGNEDTFKEMLRIKRSVQAQYNTDINFIASQTVAKNRASNPASVLATDTAAEPKAEDGAGDGEIDLGAVDEEFILEA
ncbi:uncharacterized protein V1510DRAFT_134652 [Dipodascopsis tothii]|uniref:uncharacterized protein n=1 Tax=Dipodascopsis tothii TaxID=44089 RepID=UPI0034CD172C